jgi:signal transduction histidine kinase/ActR/RegA family two-component response regulator
LLSDFCYSLSITEDGTVVVGHRGGLSHITPGTGRTKTFSRLDGIKSSAEFYPNSVFAESNGRVWFGTSEGIIVYNTSPSTKGLIPPKLNISALYVNGEKTDISSLTTLKAGYYEIVIDYIGINFSNPEMVSYQTKLEGYNLKWSGHTNSRRVVYDRVGHGKYSFALRAFNENDEGTQILSVFEFSIKKPIYITFWFYLILVGIISSALYWLVRWREKNLRTVQERLLINLDEKTKDIIVKEEIIKERKKVEKELIEAKTRAELSDKLKTSFLSNMSHEIRTPMNAIVGMSNLLKDKDFSEEEHEQFIDSILKNSESLLDLIGDILDVSKLETNQLHIKKGPCNVNDMIRGLYSKYLEELENLGKSEIKLHTFAKADDTLVLNTDSARLKQVLVKLLDNAVKYTEKGSVTFGYELYTDKITFFVQDTGIGLSEEKSEIIFDLFRKIEDDPLKLYRGTGLGLTLARYLLRLLGGEIHVESKFGAGSKFYFELPLLLDPVKTKSVNFESSEKKIKGDWCSKRILVIEDDNSNFMLIEQILLPTKIKIVRANNGDLGLKEFFDNGPFDLIIVDIKLPGIDGYEVTKKIRQEGNTLPIISHTAYAMEGDREMSIAAGCNEYIPKPTSRTTIISILSTYLDNPEN